jgi:AmmeMemoRadiSam system protein B
MFYPAEPEACRAWARKLVNISDAAPQVESSPTRALCGGIVPHAGWICSGAVAGLTIAAIAQSRRQSRRPVDLVVVFGAVHMPAPIDRAVLDSYSSWREPGGTCDVKDELRARLTSPGIGVGSEVFAVDDRFHRFEHAVEVELPLVQVAWPEAAILPVEVPLIDAAVEVGAATARRASELNLNAIFLASSDLTHYGPAYRFAPAGVGPAGLDWAKGNDRRLLDRVERFEPEQVIQDVREHANACGGGAIAAMMSACRELGATGATVLRHANSYETLAAVAPQSPDNAVGYAAVVVG